MSVGESLLRSKGEGSYVRRGHSTTPVSVCSLRSYGSAPYTRRDGLPTGVGNISLIACLFGHVEHLIETRGARLFQETVAR